MKSLQTPAWVRNLIQSWFARPRPQKKKSRRLQVETLEDRVVPSTWLVNNTSNSATTSGSLPWAAAQADTPLGREVAAYQRRGDLVSDQIVFDLLIPVMATAAADGGYILDGFPRTLSQAVQAFDVAKQHDFPLEAVVYLNVPESVLIERIVLSYPFRHRYVKK